MFYIKNKYKSLDVRDLRIYINFDVKHQSLYIFGCPIQFFIFVFDVLHQK